VTAVATVDPNHPADPNRLVDPNCLVDPDHLADLNHPVGPPDLSTLDGNRFGRGGPTAGMSKPHLGHVHLKVDDLERALSFYTGLLDLTISERHANFAFLSFGEHHHDLALQAVDGTDTPSPRSVGLYHVAFEVDSPAALRRCYEWLRERDRSVAPVDHGISKALYTDDPAGNGVELYVDTRSEPPDEWDGRNVRFDPLTL